MNSYIERLTDLAILMLQRARPVPLDMIFRLTAAGVDFSALERKYAAH